MRGIPKLWAGGAVFLAVFAALMFNGVGPASAERRVAARALQPQFGSTFRIQAQSMRGRAIVIGHGTVFGIDLTEFGYNRPRFVLTAYHVIRDPRGSIHQALKLEVRQEQSVRWVRCRLVASDARMDVALLECECDLPVSPFAPRDAVRGTPVTMIGSPAGVPLRVFGGSVRQANRAGTSVACVDYIREGCSGGPLLDSRTRRVIGVVVAGVGVGRSQEMDPHTCLYVPRSRVQEFLRRSLRPCVNGYCAQQPVCPVCPTCPQSKARAAGMVRVDASGMWLP